MTLWYGGNREGIEKGGRKRRRGRGERGKERGKERGRRRGGEEKVKREGYTFVRLLTLA